MLRTIDDGSIPDVEELGEIRLVRMISWEEVMNHPSNFYPAPSFDDSDAASRKKWDMDY